MMLSRHKSLSRLDSPYCKAALEDDGGRVFVCLQNGGDIRTASVVTLLPQVADKGYQDVVRVLLDAGADVDMADPKTNMTALMCAARIGHLTIVRLLLERGANVHTTSTTRGVNALMLAACYGHIKVVQLLLRMGSDVNARTNSGITALMLAATRGHLSTVDALLEAGADVHLISAEGRTALCYAQRAHRHKIVKRLKQAGAREAECTRKLRLQNTIVARIGKWAELLFRPAGRLARRGAACCALSARDIIFLDHNRQRRQK